MSEQFTSASVHLGTQEAFMRAFLVSALALSLAAPAALAAPALSAQLQDDAAEALRIEALQNAGRENWKGRHHYLYDDEYQPETDAAAPSVKECSEVAVRTKRSDGKTTINRISRCE
jgi:hypothetical protein